MAGNFLGNNFTNVRIDPFKSGDFPMGDRSSSSSIIDFPSNGDILMFNGTDTTAPEGYWCNTNYATTVTSQAAIDASAAVANAINNLITNEVSGQISNADLESNEIGKIETIDGRPNFILDASNIKVAKLGGTGTTSYGEAILTIGETYADFEDGGSGKEGLIQFPSMRHNSFFKFQNYDDYHNARIILSYDWGAGAHGNNIMTWNGGGKVGINKTDPKTSLEVGSQYGVSETDFGVYLDVYGIRTHWGYPTTASPNIAIYAQGGCLAYAFHTRSDERIKSDIEDVSGTEAIDLITQIESKKYYYNDPLKKSDTKTIGFIAQQVQSVYPDAVQSQKGFVYENRQVTCNEKGDVVLDISGDENTGLFTFWVKDETDDKDEIKYRKIESNQVNGICSLGKHYDEVYLFEREVNNFLSVDKDKIFALHHSAIQEMDKKYKTLLDKYNKLKNEVDVIKSNLTT